MKTLSTEEIESAYTALKATIETARPISATTWQYIRTHSKLIFYRKKTLLIQTGDHFVIAGFVVQGAIKSYYSSPKDGRQIVTRLYGPNEICSPINFHLGKRSTETIEFVSDSWLISMSYQDVMFMHDNFPDYARIYTTLLEIHSRLQDERLRDLKMLTVSQRLENLLATTAHYFNYFSLSDIASYLGTERETLTRLRSKLYK